VSEDNRSYFIKSTADIFRKKGVRKRKFGVQSGKKTPVEDVKKGHN